MSIKVNYYLKFVFKNWNIFVHNSVAETNIEDAVTKKSQKRF